jgi:hypothetical protein
MSKIFRILNETTRVYYSFAEFKKKRKKKQFANSCWKNHWTPILTEDFSLYLTSRTDFDSGLFRFPNLDTLILTTDFYVWYGAHGGCNQTAGDAYSSMAPDPTSDIYSEVRVRPFSDLYFLKDLWDWLLFVIFVISLKKKTITTHYKYILGNCIP